MGRLTDRERKEVITDYASGKTQAEIAKKFNISDTAVSKILKKYESLKSSEKFGNSTSNKSNKEMAERIVKDSLFSLSGRDFDKMHPETLLKIIEKLSFLYGEKQSSENTTPNITFVFSDLSNNGNNNT